MKGNTYFNTPDSSPLLPHLKIRRVGKYEKIIKVGEIIGAEGGT
jgi:hypothetical protein